MPNSVYRRRKLGLVVAVLAALALLSYLVYVILILGNDALLSLGASVAVETADGLRAFVVRAGAIGLLVMVLIQVARGIYPVRGHFHERQVRRWLSEALGEDIERLRRREVDRLADGICRHWNAPQDAKFRSDLLQLRDQIRSLAQDQRLPVEFPERLEAVWCRRAAQSMLEDRQDVEKSFSGAWYDAWEELRQDYGWLGYLPSDTFSADLRWKWDQAHLEAWKWATDQGITEDLLELATHRDPIEELVRLATIRDRLELFDLPLEQLCGQIGATGEQVLTDPRGRILLLAGLAGTDNALAYRALLERKQERDRSYNGAGNEEDTSLHGGGEGDNGTDGPEVSRMSSDDRDLSVLRNRLGLRIQRNIDALQVSVGVRWKRGLRIVALVLSAALAHGMVWNQRAEQRIQPLANGEVSTFESGPGFRTSGGIDVGEVAPPVPQEDETAYRPSLLMKLFELVMTTVAAGFLATVSRDLVAVIERYRG